MKQARIQPDVLALAAWLVHHFDGATPLDRRVCARVLDLSEATACALVGIERRGQLDQADRALVSLRAHLRLAHQLGRFSDAQVLHVHGMVDAIGRQIGGWLRHLDGGTLGGRRR